jgi:hypothetical protein
MDWFETKFKLRETKWEELKDIALWGVSEFVLYTKHDLVNQINKNESDEPFKLMRVAAVISRLSEPWPLQSTNLILVHFS